MNDAAMTPCPRVLGTRNEPEVGSNMIHLHTLGDTLITVGEKEVRPSSPMVFAALLYLGVERGRRVPRAALQELFFPESDERSGSHSVRQLLYKLRQLGAELDADDSSAALVSEIVDDTSEAALETASIASFRGGFLPSYVPPFSAELSRWLDTVRDQRATRIVRALLKRLKERYDAGLLDEALDVSSTVLDHDPFNEEATLTRAKVLALSGQKQKAIELLSAYSSELSVEIRLPAESLSRRLQSHVAQPQGESRLVGRDSELRSLLSQHSTAAQGLSALTVVWGEPGIGKTRLVQELAERVRLEGDRVLWAHCQQHAIGRPMGVLTDVVPSLMKCRGSLGVSPHSMAWLRKLEVRSDRGARWDGDVNAAETSRQVMLAMRDLVVSIASENAIMLVVEDVQWIDDASREFLLRYLPAEARVHVVMTSREGTLATEHVQNGRAAMFRKLEALSPVASSALLDAFLPDSSTAEPLRRTCVDLANGNPLFIRTIAHHLVQSGGLPDLEASIGDLMLQRIHSLQPASLLLLRLVAVLGTLGTNERVRQCASLDPFALMLAIQELADRGLVVRRDGALLSVHQLLTDTVLRNTPEPLRAELYMAAASQLEKEGQASREASLLWACAEFWCSSGQPDRATAALRECAAYAVELGQPRYAIPALERAQEFCSQADLPQLIEATIRIADVAADDEAILRNADAYRRTTQAVTGQAISLVAQAEIRALRRLGKDIWPKRSILLNNALSAEMPIADRRRAAKTYFLSAEESFGGSEAVEQLPALSSLTSGTDLDAIELTMIVHLTVGDVRAAAEAATTLLSRVEEYPPLAQAVTLSGIARAFLAAGMVDQSLAVSQRELALARHIGSPSDIAMATARLADSYLTIGDIRSARTWVATTEQFISSSLFARAYHLFNCVTLAICESHFVLAQNALEELKTQDEAKKRNAARSIAGAAIMLANARGTLDAEPFDLNELRQIDDSAWYHAEHLFFAVGLFLLLSARGFTQEAQARISEYFNERRPERFDPWVALKPLQLTELQLGHLKKAVKASRETPQPSTTDSVLQVDARRAVLHQIKRGSEATR